MTGTAVAGPLDRLTARAGALASGPRHDRAVRVVLALCVVEALALAAHLSTGALVTRPRYLLYPFVWVNLVAYALVRAPARPLRESRQVAVLALCVGAAYFALAAWVTGALAFAPDPPATGLHVMAAPPGWGPMLAYDGAFVRLTVVPYQFVGYAGLGLLVALAAARASRSLAAGALGLVSCVGCTLSAVGALATAVVGGASALTAAVAGVTYDLATLAFVLTVILLLAGVVPARTADSH